MLIVMDKSTHEQHLSQPLQTNNKQFKLAITFLTGYNQLLIKMVIYKITIPPGAYEIESLNDEIKRIIIEEEHYTEVDYPFTIKANFPTLGSIIEISSQGPIITFVPEDSIRDLLGLKKTTIYEEYNLSPNPVDILSFDNIFLECDIAQGMIFRGKRSGLIRNFTMDAGIQIR